LLTIDIDPFLVIDSYVDQNSWYIFFIVILDFDIKWPIFWWKFSTFLYIYTAKSHLSRVNNVANLRQISSKFVTEFRKIHGKFAATL
jgi:hypothetical protein